MLGNLCAVNYSRISVWRNTIIKDLKARCKTAGFLNQLMTNDACRAVFKKTCFITSSTNNKNAHLEVLTVDIWTPSPFMFICSLVIVFLHYTVVIVSEARINNWLLTAFINNLACLFSLSFRNFIDNRIRGFSPCPFHPIFHAFPSTCWTHAAQVNCRLNSSQHIPVCAYVRL